MINKSENKYSSPVATSPSICIPRVFPNITERRIAAIFNKLDLGEIVRIDMVKRTGDQGDFFRVFVHLEWGHSENALTTRTKLLEADGEVKVVYDDPWFWKLRASNSKGRRVRIERPEPYIDLKVDTTFPNKKSEEHPEFVTAITLGEKTQGKVKGNEDGELKEVPEALS